MKKIVPNISVDNCKKALEYYKDLFGGEITNIQMADDKEMFKGYEGKIVHAEIHVNSDCVIYLNDMFDEKGAGGPEQGQISLLLQLESQSEADDLYKSLSKTGKVVFQLQKTFWGSYHAVVTDYFGITWSLDYSGR